MSELASFDEFIGHKMQEFGENASPEELLDLWKAPHPSQLDFRRDVQAIQSAIDAMNAGDVGAPLDSFDREFRKKHGFA